MLGSVLRLISVAAAPPPLAQTRPPFHSHGSGAPFSARPFARSPKNRPPRDACPRALAVVMLTCTPAFGDSAASKDLKGAVNTEPKFGKPTQNFDMCVRAARHASPPRAPFIPSFAPAHIVALCVLTSTRMVRFDRQDAYGDKERAFR